MKKTDKKTLIAYSFLLIFILIAFGIESYFSYLKVNKDRKPNLSEQVNLCYKFPSWEDVECLYGGRKTRDVLIKEPKCSFLGEIDPPEEITKCEFTACSEPDLIIGEWGECIDNKQTRLIRPKNISKCGVDTDAFPLQRNCNTTGELTKITLLSDYITEIDSTTSNPYRPNHSNIKLNFNGDFKTIKLIVDNARTFIKGGEEFKIEADYYIMFSLNDPTPRALNLSREDLGNGNTKLVETTFDNGIFKGTETPMNGLVYDLENLTMARASQDNVFGSYEENYLEDINNLENNSNIYMTLYIADGRSMTEPDEFKRVFGSINAILEYECLDDSNCSIERLES